MGTVEVAIQFPISIPIPNSIFLFQFPIAKHRPPLPFLSTFHLSLSLSLSAFGLSSFFQGSTLLGGDSKSYLLICFAASIFFVGNFNSCHFLIVEVVVCFDLDEKRKRRSILCLMNQNSVVCLDGRKSIAQKQDFPVAGY